VERNKRFFRKYLRFYQRCYRRWTFCGMLHRIDW